MIRIPVLIVFLLCLQSAYAQKPSVELLSSGSKAAFRGLSVVNDNVVWVSGTKGTVGRSNNGGKNWNWFTVKGFEKTDFRDIEGFDASTAVIMAVDSPACILKTTDGGENWTTVYRSDKKGMFLDAMDFVGDQYGIVVGDPIDNKMFIAETFDAGDNWRELKTNVPVLDSGEAFFAASGTNVRLMINKKFFAASGGMRSRMVTKEGFTAFPIMQGAESKGANSIDVYDAGNGKGSNQMVIVGGDFYKPDSIGNNCYYSENGGRTWKEPKEKPHGYRSCVEYLSKDDILSCGLNGVDYSFNGGKTWSLISKTSFHVCHIAKNGTAIYLAGEKGQIGKIVWK